MDCKDFGSSLGVVPEEPCSRGLLIDISIFEMKTMMFEIDEVHWANHHHRPLSTRGG